MYSALGNVLQLAPSLYMLQVYDRVLASRSLETLGMLAAITVVALVVTLELERTRGYLLTKSSEQFDKLVSPQLLRAFVEASARGSGQGLQQATRDAEAIRQFVAGQAIVVAVDAPWAVVYVAVIFLFHPLLGGLTVLGSGILLALAWANHQRSKAPLVRHATANSQSNDEMRQMTRNAETVVALGSLDNMLSRYESARSDATHGAAEIASINSDFRAVTKAFRQFLQVVMLGTGAWLVIDHLATPGVMLATTILLGKALQPVEQIVGSWKSFIDTADAYPRFQRAMRRVHEDCKVKPIELPLPTGHLQVEDICWSPPGAGKPLLHQLSFSVNPGELLVITGASGSGKSSLARLLIGLTSPDQGVVRLDGADISQWPSGELGKYLGYLPQQVELFSGSVAENIARMQERQDTAVYSERIVEAAKLAGAHELILRLPNGYQTILNASPYQLSGGQRQRIALARAVYGGPRLLVLDEPNSSLDTLGEAALRGAIQGLQQSGSAIVAITHRPDLLHIATRILELRDGQMVQIDKVEPASSVQHVARTPRNVYPVTNRIG